MSIEFLIYFIIFLVAFLVIVILSKSIAAELGFPRSVILGIAAAICLIFLLFLVGDGGISFSRFDAD